MPSYFPYFQFPSYNSPFLKLYFPKLEYTTDNAAMIAIVGYLKFKDNLFSELNLESKARYSI